MSSSGTAKQKAKLNKAIQEQEYKNLFFRLKAEHIKLSLTKSFIELANKTSATEAIAEVDNMMNLLTDFSQEMSSDRDLEMHISSLKHILSWYVNHKNIYVTMKTANKKVVQYQKVIDLILNQQYL